MAGKIAEQLVEIPIGSINLEGILRLPENARAIVIFVHGSGSSRLSPRNTYVAEVLNRYGFGTLLFDLLTEEEDRIYENRFDIPLLARRLNQAASWIKMRRELRNLPTGYFGASTGAAAAIIGAAESGMGIYAVVSRGGRPDLAGGSLARLQSPILLIVGGEDGEVIALNEEAAAQIKCEKKISIIPGATHLFEEPGTLEQAAKSAADWFEKYL